MRFALAALVATLSVVSASTHAEKDSERQFTSFIKTFNKKYTSEDFFSRYNTFKANLAIIKEHNASGASYELGVNEFADMSFDEFRSTRLGLLKRDNSVHRAANAVELDATEAAAAVDWRTSGIVTPVKDQGQCGSCWVFSAVETIESVCCLSGYPLTILSEQQIVDCDSDGGVQGCNGGWPEDVYTYTQRFGGLDTEASYPYQAVDGTCQASQTGLYKCPLTSWKFVSQDASTENTMQQYLYSNSPLSIACDAETWQFYTGGVVTADSCGQDLDHAIQLTGWTVKDGQNAWTVRNSWGADWGESGYIYLQLGQNTCGIATHVTVPCVKTTSGATRC